MDIGSRGRLQSRESVGGNIELKLHGGLISAWAATAARRWQSLLFYTRLGRRAKVPRANNFLLPTQPGTRRTTDALSGLMVQQTRLRWRSGRWRGARRHSAEDPAFPPILIFSFQAHLAIPVTEGISNWFRIDDPPHPPTPARCSSAHSGGYPARPSRSVHRDVPPEAGGPL